jgi:hypothetical protein
MILTHLNFDIFASTSKFLNTIIRYHNLKSGYRMDIIMGFNDHSPMNKIVADAIIIQNNHYVVFDVANKF